MRIAITGGIAEGKSTVLSIIASLGHATASADEFARQVFNDEAVNEEIAAAMGRTGTVTPAAVREAILGDPRMRRKVNAITHMRILERIDNSSAQFIEVPLLIETCVYPYFDRVWLVTCGPVEQLKRLTDRMGDGAAAAKLLSTQIKSRAKTPFSDHIIRTNQDSQIVRQLVAESVARVSVS